MTSWSQLTRSFAVLTALGAIGALASTQQGCGGGDSRYYCDATGCYSCDGYGCSTVNPPTPTACTGDLSCKPTESCTDKGCVARCKSDPECPQGTVCDLAAQLCKAPGTTPGSQKQCTTTKDCAAGSACEGGRCQACGGTNGPCPCSAASDCSGAGQVCSAGYCASASSLCKYSSECGAGKVCADGQCLADCSNNPSACGAGQVCAKGACVADPNAKPQCANDTQCGGSTPKCVAGKCTAQCTSDSTCGAGQWCDQGACVVDNRPKPACSSTAQCAQNQTCVEGYCKYSCSTDNDCKLIDARIGYCGKDKVCRTLQEAQAQCTSTADCASGKTCVANQCQ